MPAGRKNAMGKVGRLSAAVVVLCGLAGCGASDETAPQAGPPPSTSSTPVPPPTSRQVEWLNQFCRATAVFVTAPEPPPDLHDEFMAMDFESYLRSVGNALTVVEHQVGGLDPEAFPNGPELIESYTAAAERLSTDVEAYTSQASVAEETLRGAAADISAALDTLTPDGLDVAELMADNDTVAQAHELAERCRPAAAPATPPAAPVALPAARNGANLDSCGDGSCEVLVSPAAVVPVPQRYGFTLMRVRSIADGVMLIGAKLEGGAIVSPLDTGRSTIMNGLEVKAVAVGDGQAVLSLSPL